MKFPQFNRRLHMYLGLALSPWFLAYGVSSAVFAHPRWGESVYGQPVWKVRFERPYALPISPNAGLPELGATLVRASGIGGTYGAYRPDPDRINVYVHTFWTATQITYDLNTKMLRAADQQFRWDHFLTGLHGRGGFEHSGVLDDAWAVMVDIVCAGFLIWIASGLYMWWGIPRHRGWGLLALGTGAVSFGVFLLMM